jgi:hypothetical protein
VPTGRDRASGIAELTLTIIQRATNLSVMSHHIGCRSLSCASTTCLYSLTVSDELKRMTNDEQETGVQWIRREEFCAGDAPNRDSRLLIPP